MSYYQNLSQDQKNEKLKELYSTYEEYKSRNLSLDLSRGKPNSEQLDLSSELLTLPLTKEMCFSKRGVDYRNYGILDGTEEAKQLFSELLHLNKDNIFVGGNSSLQLMYDTLCRAMLFGNPDSKRPWCKEDTVKWICVCPGYDRHFKITEDLGFELISVLMLPSGPDMDKVEEIVKDEAVKGIWCAPRVISNLAFILAPSFSICSYIFSAFLKNSTCRI